MPRGSRPLVRLTTALASPASRSSRNFLATSDRLTDAEVRKEVRKHVAWLTGAIDRADAALAAAVKASPAWRAKDALLWSIPGVGPVATLTLSAGLPELGTTTGGRLAAPVGLAPFADDSGTRQGGRQIRGGRAPVRRALYLAALTAVVHNPAMRAVKARLVAREAAQGGPHRGRPGAPGDRQRDHPVRSAVAVRGRRSSSDFRLTWDTVAFFPAKPGAGAGIRRGRG